MSEIGEELMLRLTYKGAKYLSNVGVTSIEGSLWDKYLLTITLQRHYKVTIGRVTVWVDDDVIAYWSIL